MPDIVVKFGGSSLKTRKDLQKVIEVIISYKKPVIVVVSAFYGITDFLASRICNGFEKGEEIDQIIKELDKRNSKIIDDNFDNPSFIKEAKSETSV